MSSSIVPKHIFPATHPPLITAHSAPLEIMRDPSVLAPSPATTSTASPLPHPAPSLSVSPASPSPASSPASDHALPPTPTLPSLMPSPSSPRTHSPPSETHTPSSSSEPQSIPTSPSSSKTSIASSQASKPDPLVNQHLMQTRSKNQLLSQIPAMVSLPFLPLPATMNHQLSFKRLNIENGELPCPPSSMLKSAIILGILFLLLTTPTSLTANGCFV
ncbi:PREDICTED: classical arabinogalactan protein 9-like [Camelina sativa]|uniref:Classical arabinogalactan protein 9-like n=1 Tax=Camelina sativa TaxID=90675 RepID=A0ABM0Y574_CAMSA|nr:PREDICTED: classical arabinogalactan protein 9-like [Camelina sativa]